jgi:hypothetical protein
LRTLTCAVLLATLAACGARPAAAPAVAPPPALGLDGPATYRAYLDARPSRMKMRHQVESSFGGRDEVIEGFFVLERPDRFYVNARSPMGPALFEVKSAPPAPLEVKAYLPQLRDGRMARFLARDIRRIYVEECPPDASVTAEGDGFAVRCAVDAREAPIMEGDAPDDALELHLDRAAQLREKSFWRGGKPTATVRYLDLRPESEVWLAHRIELTPADAPYHLAIVLLAVDFGFDVSRVFGGARP